MPTYMFKCEKCDNVFEEIVKFDTETYKCEKCGNEAIRIFCAKGISHKYGKNCANPSKEPTNKEIKEIGKLNFLGKQDLTGHGRKK